MPCGDDDHDGEGPSMLSCMRCSHFCVDIKHGCIDRKVLVTAIGTKIIRMVPPLIATEEDCDKAYEALKGAVEEVAGK